MNKVVLLGRLTAEPDLKKTPGGTSVLSFTTCTGRRFFKEGEKSADFIKCVAWQKTAEFIAKYFKKGQMIGLAGSIQTRDYTDSDGKKRYITEVVVSEAYFTQNKADGYKSSFDGVSEQDFENDFMPGAADEELPF